MHLCVWFDRRVSGDLMEVKLFAPWRFVFSLQLLRFGAVSGVKFDFISETQSDLFFAFTYWKLSLLSSFVFRFCWFYCGLELRMLKPGILREVMKVEYLLTRASTIRSSNRGRDQVEKYIPLLPRFIMSRRRQGVVIIKEGRCLVFLRRTRMLWNNLSGFT